MRLGQLRRSPLSWRWHWRAFWPHRRPQGQARERALTSASVLRWLSSALAGVTLALSAATAGALVLHTVPQPDGPAPQAPVVARPGLPSPADIEGPTPTPEPSPTPAPVETPAPTPPPRETPPPAAVPVPVAVQEPPPPPPPPPQPPPPPAPPALPGLAHLEAQMLEAINAQRSAAGLRPLALDSTLVAIGRARVNDMVRLGYFSHYRPDGTLALQSLLEEYGVAYSIAGENIARNNYAESESVAVAVQGFMNSPSHRANMLDGRYTHIGVGAVNDGGGMYYYAVIFKG